MPVRKPLSLESLIPTGVDADGDLQSVIPRLAKDQRYIDDVEQVLHQIPTEHKLMLGDARDMSFIDPNSIHLVLTSPPYWTLKEYRDTEGQMGHIEDYEEFLAELGQVWSQCYESLVPGGRLICVVGDVCLSRRKNNGRHTVIPLHASIQEQCRRIGFDNLAPIIWHKIANAAYEVEGGGGGFLGKPYEPNAVIKNDIEYILMLRKPGGYRKPTNAARLLSVIGEANHRQWFQQVWTGLTGASTREHPAPYPLELARRLIRMFSFAGDTVLDPFMGTGTTVIAAGNSGRSSVGVEVDPIYFEQAQRKVEDATSVLFSGATVEISAEQPT